MNYRRVPKLSSLELILASNAGANSVQSLKPTPLGVGLTLSLYGMVKLE
jgi:hypothetical protein